MNLNGYSAWISVDGNALKEYNIDISNGNNATCWIASEAGKASFPSCTKFVLRSPPLAYVELEPTEVYSELEGLESHKQGIRFRKTRWNSLRRLHRSPCISRHAPHTSYRAKINDSDFDYDGETIPFLSSSTHR
jgi:hypothetical protein